MNFFLLFYSTRFRESDPVHLPFKLCDDDAVSLSCFLLHGELAYYAMRDEYHFHVLEFFRKLYVPMAMLYTHYACS